MTLLRSLQSGVCASLLAMALTAPAVGASIIYQPQSAVVNFGGTMNANTGIVNTYNQSGLPDTYISGTTVTDTYVALNPLHNVGASGQEWHSSAGVTSAEVTYNMGTLLNLGVLLLWNEDSKGIGKFSLSSSSDGVTFSTILLSGVTPFQTPVGDIGFEPYRAQLFLFAAVSTQYLRLDMECPGQVTASGCAIGEVAFATPGVVPLPGAIGLFASGLALVGLVGRRRKRKIQAAA